MDTAISWWLQSLNNNDPNNTYDFVTVYGNHSDDPWQDPDGAKLIGNQLRTCNYVGLYMKFPTIPAPLLGCGNQAKHVITAWGDNKTNADLESNPAQVKVTDSDRSTGQTHAVETYNYDPYVNRWSIDYLDANHPYLANIVTLSPPPTNPCTGSTVTVVGSARIKQNGTDDATALHYEVGVRDSEHICSYETSIDAGSDTQAQIVLVHKSSKHHYLIVDWEFKPGTSAPGDGEVPPGTEVTITTKLTLPRDNLIYYDDVKFGYSDPPVFVPSVPGFDWVIITPGVQTPGSRGFVIGAFELFEDALTQTPIVKYRLQHEYDEYQDPNHHYFELSSLESMNTYYIGNVKFGYSELEVTDLWNFATWTLEDPATTRHLFRPSCIVAAELFGPLSQDGTIDGFCIVIDPPDVSADRTTRSLRFKVTAPLTAAAAASQVAIKVTMIDLQNPIPPNAPCCPPQNFGAYESATCTAAGETNGCARWVGKPGTFLESQDTPALGNYRAARLQCTPFYYDWVTETVSKPITVVGAEILPSSEYSVQIYGASCMGNEATCANVSAPLTMKTRRFGDVESLYNPPDPSGQPNAIDIAQVVAKFKNTAGAPVKARAQVQPNVPELNTDVNALDISAVVDAVKGRAYPFSGPCPCPSGVVCGAMACTTGVGACIAAYGPGAMCVKTCSGGANDGQPCVDNNAIHNHCPGGTCSTPTCRDRCGRCTPP